LKLRVLASQEMRRQRSRRSPKTWAAHQFDLLRLWFNNLMRPMAVPVAGGLFSAVLLFGTMAPALTFNRQTMNDVPTVLSTEATVQTSFSFELSDEDIVVDVTIDEYGGVIDYSIPSGQRWFSDPILRKSVENALVCTRFAPATVFGQATTGRTRLTFRSSRVEVKG
jgi:hypothetical protein